MGRKRKQGEPVLELTPQELAHIQATLAKQPHHDRARAFLAMSQMASLTDISEKLYLPRTLLYTWRDQFRQRRLAALKVSKKGRPRTRMLRQRDHIRRKYEGKKSAEQVVAYWLLGD